MPNSEREQLSTAYDMAVDGGASATRPPAEEVYYGFGVFMGISVTKLKAMREEMQARNNTARFQPYNEKSVETNSQDVDKSSTSSSRTNGSKHMSEPMASQPTAKIQKTTARAIKSKQDSSPAQRPEWDVKSDQMQSNMALLASAAAPSATASPHTLPRNSQGSPVPSIKPLQSTPAGSSKLPLHHSQQHIPSLANTLHPLAPTAPLSAPVASQSSPPPPQMPPLLYHHETAAGQSQPQDSALHQHQHQPQLPQTQVQQPPANPPNVPHGGLQPIHPGTYTTPPTHQQPQTYQMMAAPPPIHQYPPGGMYVSYAVHPQQVPYGSEYPHQYVYQIAPQQQQQQPPPHQQGGAIDPRTNLPPAPLQGYTQQQPMYHHHQLGPQHHPIYQQPGAMVPPPGSNGGSWVSHPSQPHHLIQPPPHMPPIHQPNGNGHYPQAQQQLPPPPISTTSHPPTNGSAPLPQPSYDNPNAVPSQSPVMNAAPSTNGAQSGEPSTINPSQPSMSRLLPPPGYPSSIPSLNAYGKAPQQTAHLPPPPIQHQPSLPPVSYQQPPQYVTQQHMQLHPPMYQPYPPQPQYSPYYHQPPPGYAPMPPPHQMTYCPPPTPTNGSAPPTSNYGSHAMPSSNPAPPPQSAPSSNPLPSVNDISKRTSMSFILD